MHAYLIIAHNQFELLNQLLRAIDYVENDIFIHIDQKAGNIDEQKIVEGITQSQVHFIKRQNIVWGHFSQIECELSLFTAAVEKKDYQYLHLISGVDFPIKSQKYIHEFFDRNNGKEFIHFEGKDFPEEDYEKVRCYYPLQKYVGNKKKDSSFLYCIQRAIVNTQKLLKVDRHKKENIRFYKGANWVSITGAFARYLVEHKEELYKTYRYSMCCDEVFVHTLFMNSPFQDNLYDKSFADDYKMCKRYIDWNRGGPYVFRLEDYDELMASDALFARKFSYDIDRQIVDKIYQNIKETGYSVIEVKGE